MSIETELDGYRNSIAKAQGTNEQLTLMQNRIEADISMVKKLIGVSMNKQEILKTEYSKYSRMLHETEQALNKAKTVGCNNLLFGLRYSEFVRALVFDECIESLNSLNPILRIPRNYFRL